MALENIEHFVFLMLENRSFDHMLGYLSRQDTPVPLPVDGLNSDDAWELAVANHEAPGLPPQRPRRLSTSERIDDPPHGWECVEAQIETDASLPGPRRMGGFVKSYVDAWRAENGRRPARADAVMGYYGGDAVWAHDFLARNYCVCDHWFTPLPAGTQPNRLMAMGGHSNIIGNEAPLRKHDLVYNWLKTNDIGWRVYRWGGNLPFFALMPVWWDNILASLLFKGKFRHFDKLRSHWQSDDELPSVIFVEPAYSELRGDRANDDHAPTSIAGGQSLIADVYDILTGNEERWAKTLLIVTYDEHGGFFDHVPPLPIRKEVDGHMFETTGPRVPALLVSPFVEPGQVFSDPVDHTAFLSMLAEKFTPATPYSDEVATRQASFPAYGALSRALRATPRPGPPPKLQRPLIVALLSGLANVFATVSGLRPAFLSPADEAPEAGTATALAFDEAARKTVAARPDLLEDPEWQGLGQSVAKPPPATIHGDHIGDN